MIVNSIEVYNSILNKMNNTTHILTNIYCDHFLHKNLNKVLCTTITFVDGQSYTISVNHPDAKAFNIPNNTIHTMSKDSIDLASFLYSHEFLQIEYTNYIKNIHSLFSLRKNINEIVPINIWSKVVTEYNTACLEKRSLEIDPSVYTFNHNLFKVLHDIENAGVAVDTTLFYQFFGEDKRKFYGDSNIVYTKYNPFTITQRPSNTFGGINYSALNKKNGCRSAFISRYPSGSLVMIDYEAFHLRLIAEALSVQLPTDTSLHTVFASFYFPNMFQITQELYAESKQKTFEILYGLSDKTYGIELFEKVKEAKKEIKETSILTFPTGIEIQKTSENVDKYFNYYIQNLEVFKIVPVLDSVIRFLENTNNHLVLYTYDSILLDMENYNEDLIKEINKLMNSSGNFPTRTYVGKNYNELVEIKL